MERQYIGARYVPKFADPIEWSDQTSYEALTIVTYLGASYTSKKAVPAGIRPTDNRYWVVTGNYNAQVEEYRRIVQEYANEVEGYSDRINENTEYIKKQNRKWLFIGDSYDGTSLWIQQTASQLGLASNDYWNIAKSGTSFSDDSWLNQVKEWVESHPTEVGNIGTIVVGGGINDATATRYNLVPQAIANFMEYIKTTFNDCTVKIGYFGWAIAGTTFGGDREPDYRRATWQNYLLCGAWGAEYLNGVEMCTHNRDYIIDGIHPNEQGGSRIATAMVNAIKSGCATVSYSTQQNMTPVVGTYQGGFKQTINNNMVYSEMLGWYFDLDGVEIGYEWVEIGKLAPKLSNGFPVTSSTFTITTMDDNVAVVKGEIKCENGSLYLRFSELANASSWKSYNVKRIWDYFCTIIEVGVPS